VDSWKEFQVNVVTHSTSHHLAAISELTQRYGYARVADVARHLNITPGSVSLTLKPLKARGLVLEDPNRFLLLSEQAKRIVDRICARRALVRTFFEQVLGVSPEQAEIDACKIEHLLSDEVGRRLEEFLGGHSANASSGRSRARPRTVSRRRLLSLRRASHGRA
jgi:DtxR family Mn-dependent transcriptional regulator